MNQWINEDGSQVVKSEVRPEGFSPKFAKSRVMGGKYRPYTRENRCSAQWRESANSAMSRAANYNFNYGR